MDPSFFLFLGIYYITACLFAFVLFWIDKRAAIRRAWRVPEAVLLAFCAVGGAPGGFLAMQLFRHKTRHRKFTVTVPLLLILHLSLLAWLFGPVRIDGSIPFHV